MTHSHFYLSSHLLLLTHSQLSVTLIRLSN
nr:MAG TPA: hypothetical protein [Caudoviricetes sp.]